MAFFASPARSHGFPASALEMDCTCKPAWISSATSLHCEIVGNTLVEIFKYPFASHSRTPVCSNEIHVGRRRVMWLFFCQSLKTRATHKIIALPSQLPMQGILRCDAHGALTSSGTPCLPDLVCPLSHRHALPPSWHIVPQPTHRIGVENTRSHLRLV